MVMDVGYDFAKEFCNTHENGTPKSEFTKTNNSLNINTVQAVIRKLLSKEYIQVTDIVYSGTILTRSYSPKLSKNEMTIQQFSNQLREENDKNIIHSLVITLLKNTKKE